MKIPEDVQKANISKDDYVEIRSQLISDDPTNIPLKY